jgi:septal ring factor EnvC (AmiA/AmiB activator)
MLAGIFFARQRGHTRPSSSAGFTQTMLRFLTLVFLACLLSPAMADSRSDAQLQLDAAHKDVVELKKLLDQLQKDKSGVQQDLKKTESEMGQLEKQVKDLQLEMNNSNEQIQQLDKQKKKLQESRLEQQRLIGIQARAAYQSGNQEYLKLLLNQQNPEKFSRTLTYYDYLSKARLEQLATFNETLRQLANVEQDIVSQQALLAEQKSALEGRRELLAQARKERQLVLAKLKKASNANSHKLKAREQEQVALGNVLKTIEETLARQAREAQAARKLALAAAAEAAEQARIARLDTRDAAANSTKTASGPLVSSSGASYGGAFSSAKGKLPWPVNGRLLAGFGTPRGGDERTKWDGVLISASLGSQVHAVHGGRVVFADWLRGAGLLVILDHGNGYLSLYGHNQSLLKDAGDIVKAGEAIGTVGNSGGQEEPALYFAIRQQGRPSNPVQWCRAQG